MSQTVITETRVENEVQSHLKAAKVDTLVIATVEGKTVGVGEVDVNLSHALVGKELDLARKALTLKENFAYSGWSIPHIGLNIYCTYVAVSYTVSGELSLLTLLVFAWMMFAYTDLISGVLHLVLDNPFFLNTPIDALARGFQNHHLDTSLITKKDLWLHIRVVNMPMFWVGAVSYSFLSHVPLYYAFVPILTLMLWYMQMCHRWAHMPANLRGPVITFLQKNGLAISGAEHQRHHKAPYNNNFCIMNGWANRFFNHVVRIDGFTPTSKIWAPLFPAMCMAPPTMIWMLMG